MQVIFLVFTLIFGLPGLPVLSQDLEPRLLSPGPTGMNIAIASYGYSTGNILLDNSLPIEDLKATLNNVVAAYARSFGLFGRLAKFDVILPYSFGTFSGKVINVDSTTARNGLGDPLIRLSVSLIGNKAMDMGEFSQATQQKFNLGAAIRIRPPLGQYDDTKLINLGANRWAAKSSLAGSYAFSRKFTLEAHTNVWVFSENTSFFNGNTLKQKPIITLQMHGIYTFKQGIWAALSTGKSFMGETALNGVPKNDSRNSWRYGGVFAYNLNRHHVLKIAFTSGLSTRYGADFTSIILAYQFLWFSNPKSQFQ